MMLLQIIVMLAGIILEGALGGFYLGGVAFSRLFLLHGVAVLLLVTGCALAFRSSRLQPVQKPMLFMSLMMIAFFPVLGFLGAIGFVVSIEQGKQRFKKGVFEEYEEYISEHEQGRLSAMPEGFKTITVRDEISFEPYLDIIRGNESRLKQKVIDKLIEQPTSDSVGLIKEALKDHSADVRLYAAGALIKIDAAMSEAIERVGKLAMQRGLKSDYANLGDYYTHYARLGIVDATLTQHYWQSACDAYQSALDIETDQPQVMVHYSHVLLRLKKYEKVKNILSMAVKIWPDHPEILLLRSQAAFYLGEYADTAAFLTSFPVNGVDSRYGEVLDYWK